MATTKFKTQDGTAVPDLAFGTWQIPNEDACRCVKEALECGYTHIDTAAAYENEEGVGQAIRESGIDRKKLFVTTKVPAEAKTYEEAKQYIAASLEKLNIEYIDLLLIHAPKPWDEMHGGSEKMYFEENVEVWKALCEAKATGKVKAIGVSNFNIADLQNLFDHSEERPVANQIRVHVGHVPDKLIAFCNENNIAVEAYSPNATGRLRNNETLCKIASSHGKTPTQVAIRYDQQLGLVPLPKTTHKEFMEQNRALDFDLSKEEMEQLLAIKDDEQNKLP